MLGHFLLRKLDIEVLFESKKISLSNIDAMRPHYDLMDVLVRECLSLPEVIPEEFRDLHHVIHRFYYICDKIIEKGNANFVNSRPPVKNKQIEYMKQQLCR